MPLHWQPPLKHFTFRSLVIVSMMTLSFRLFTVHGVRHLWHFGVAILARVAKHFSQPEYPQLRVTGFRITFKLESNMAMHSITVIFRPSNWNFKTHQIRHCKLASTFSRKAQLKVVSRDIIGKIPSLEYLACEKGIVNHEHASTNRRNYGYKEQYTKNLEIINGSILTMNLFPAQHKIWNWLPALEWLHAAPLVFFSLFFSLLFTCVTWKYNRKREIIFDAFSSIWKTEMSIFLDIGLPWEIDLATRVSYIVLLMSRYNVMQPSLSNKKLHKLYFDYFVFCFFYQFSISWTL